MKKNNKKIFMKEAIVSVLLILFLLFTILYSHKVCDEKKLDWGNLIGMLCQVVISISCCIVSIICISLSLQNENIYGIPRRKFDKLKEGIRFTVLRIILIALILSISSLLMYSFNLYLSCIFFLILIAIFCFVICFSEIPLMCHNEKSIINVVRNRLEFEMSNKSELSKDLKTVIQNIITEDSNLKKLYSSLKKEKNEDYNKQLFIKLLEIQSDYAYELSKQDGVERDKKAERLVNNIEDILKFNEDYNAINITCEEIFNYLHLIIRVLIITYEIESSRNKTINITIGLLPFIDFYKENKHKDFVIRIIIKMISVFLTKSDLRLAYELKRICSQWQHSLTNGGALTIIFALTSLHLEYLSNSAINVTEKYRVEIREFVKDKSIMKNYQTSSWAELYTRFLDDFSLKFKDFFYYYKLNDGEWDMRIYDAHAHFIILDEMYAIKWFLANLFSSYAVFEYDYNILKSENFEYSNTLMRVGDLILYGEQTKSNMIRHIQFFLNDRNFLYFESDENMNHRFSNFISDLHKVELQELVNESTKTNLDKLAKKYENAICDSLKKEWGYSEGLDMSNSSSKFIRTIIEIGSFSMNYDDFMIENLSEKVKLEIERSISKKAVYLSNQSDFKKCITEHKKLYASKMAKYLADKMIESFRLEDKIKMTTFDSSILSNYYILSNEAMKFGFEIDIQIKKLTKKQISEKAEEFKFEDGHYIYEGAFLSREELEDIIKKQYAFLILKFNYKVNIDKSNVYLIDMK